MTEEQTSQEPVEEQAKSGGAWRVKAMVAGFMGCVVGLECLVAYLMFPSPEKVAALAKKNLEQQLPESLTVLDPVISDDEIRQTAEIDLGEYSITVTQANSSTSLRVDFQLVGTVLEEDAGELASLFDRNVGRFRDKVLLEIRKSEPVDLADPALALIKRRILEKSNTLFGKPILRSIVFSQFSYFEQ